MLSEPKNKRVKSYLEEVEDTIHQDSRVAVAFLTTISVGATNLTMNMLGFLVGGVQGIQKPSEANIIQRVTQGAAEGKARWAKKAEDYRHIPEVSAGVTGGFFGALGGVLHGSGKFFVNKCRSTRPGAHTAASQSFVEMKDDHKQEQVDAVMDRVVPSTPRYL